MKLARSFYVDRHADEAAQALLGKVLVTKHAKGTSTAMITETEAYMGVADRASHAYGGRRTKRNASMYGIGGTAYVYLCYGIHHLFNVVVGPVDLPEAVLIRAVRPIDGLDLMVQRRPEARTSTGGPGTLTEALGIRTTDDGEDLIGDRIWIEDRSYRIPTDQLIIGPRVGVDYAGADAMLPYRYRVASSR